MEHQPPHKLLIPPALLKLDHFIEEVVLPITGILLITQAPYITAFIGYLMGGVMLLFGGLMMGHALWRREYASRETHNTALALSLLAFGVIVLLKHEDCIVMLGTIWGFYGIYFGVGDLTELFYRIAHREKCVALAFEAVIGLALSVLLLLHPVEHFETHVRILGVELIIASLRYEHFRTVGHPETEAEAKARAALEAEQAEEALEARLPL